MVNEDTFSFQGLKDASFDNSIKTYTMQNWINECCFKRENSKRNKPEI